MTEAMHDPSHSAAVHRWTWRALVRHFLEMVVAMFLGMVLVDPLWRLLFGAAGASEVLHIPAVEALVMATNMNLGMGAWMRYRGHGPRPILEMAAVMYLSFVAFFPLAWTGMISGADMMTAGHVVMLPAMVILMLWRRQEYGVDHRGHRRNRSHSAPAPHSMAGTRR